MEIIMPNENEAKSQVDLVVQECMHVEVLTEDDYKNASEFLRKIKSSQSKVKDLFEDSKKKAHEAHKAITAAEKKLLEPLLSIETKIKVSMASYIHTQEVIRRREAELARKKIEEEKKRIEEENAKKLEEMKALGFVESDIKIEQKKVDTSILSKIPEEPKSDGISTRKAYSGEVTDLKKLCKAISQGVLPENLISVNQSALNKYIDAFGATINFDFIKIVERTIIIARK